MVLGNTYGPSETHVAAAYRLAGAPADWPESPPIGGPITNMRIYLLDAELEPVPRCVPGEVFIAGFVSWGYVGRPDLTAERFVPDPFSVRGDRMYRTGDLARFSATGQLEFLERVDRQLKVRGLRVEPGELEAVLCAHPLVREAVVAADAADQQQLVAYVVPTDPQMPPRPTELRSQMRRMLPISLVPSRFVVIPMLPITSRGKLDYRLLPASGETLTLSEPPQTREEHVVARVWQEILGIASIGRGDDFFELGGHSLLATKAVVRLRQEFGLAVPLRILFDNPTVAELAGALADADGSRLPRLGG
jgi:acyl-coenzyme A synthetase/AMP-(fatty) acid ligase